MAAAAAAHAAKTASSAGMDIGREWSKQVPLSHNNAPRQYCHYGNIIIIIIRLVDLQSALQ